MILDKGLKTLGFNILDKGLKWRDKDFRQGAKTKGETIVENQQ